MKAIIVGVSILAVSALNVYLPAVGNMLDQWRVGFSVVAFLIGWGIIIRGLTKILD